MTALEPFLETDTAGDAMSICKWSRASTYWLRDHLAAEGVRICPNSVGKVLKASDYSLRCNRKSIAETHHPDRDRQFRIIAEQRKRFEDRHQPIISVDTKKRELIGNFNNRGKRWQHRDQIDQTLVHDFPSCAGGVAIPYGIYELLTNLGTVLIGTSYDTPEFAVDAISTWLTTFGFARYGTIRELLILADTGGSNGCRPRLWKYSLFHKISKAHGISISVCHYPSGASKWNPVEHRLFSQISNNWRGVPLRSHELMLGYIQSTRTKAGLRVQALLTEKVYEKGIKITDDKMKSIKLASAQELPQWNYTIG